MKKIILLISLILFSFADDNLNDEFDSEFTNKSLEVFDPLSGYNRLMTTFNDKAYIHVFNPIAEGYAYVVPDLARTGLDNFFHNLFFPIRFTNNLLQLKFQNSAEELGRFLVNTIWGIGGLMDVAKSELQWQAHSEDFGQTLGFYGVGDAIPVVLPLLGPSNLRDIVGLGGDYYLSPLTTMGDNSIKYKIPNNLREEFALETVYTTNKASLKLGQYESLKKDALDLYPFLRDVYAQARKKQIEE